MEREQKRSFCIDPTGHRDDAKKQHANNGASTKRLYNSVGARFANWDLF